MTVCFVVDEDLRITAWAYNKLCFNFLICWDISASKVEFCGIQKSFILVIFIMDWRLELCWCFSAGFLKFVLVWLHEPCVQQYMYLLFMFLVSLLDFSWSFWFGYLRFRLCFRHFQGFPVAL